MKIIKVEQLERLEKICGAIERAEIDHPSSPIIKDLKWLTNELRKAYSRIEELAK